MTTTTVAVVVGLVAAGMVLWRLVSPQTFERWIARSPRARFLGWWRYRRVWKRRMTAYGLCIVGDGGVLVPRLHAVEIGRSVDHVQVHMLEGQSPWQYETRASDIARTFGVRECRVSLIGPGTVGMVLRHSDSPTDTTAPARLDTLWKDAA